MGDSENMNAENLQATARALVASGKGILAADESTGTIEKRFRSIGIPSTEENRRAYREMLFTAPGLGEFISGVILFDETIRQKTAGGTTFVAALERQGTFASIEAEQRAKAPARIHGKKI